MDPRFCARPIFEFPELIPPDLFCHIVDPFIMGDPGIFARPRIWVPRTYPPELIFASGLYRLCLLPFEDPFQVCENKDRWQAAQHSGLPLAKGSMHHETLQLKSGASVAQRMLLTCAKKMTLRRLHCGVFARRRPPPAVAARSSAVVASSFACVLPNALNSVVTPSRT